MNRVTDKHLQSVVDRLNRLTNNPLDPYSVVDTVGHFRTQANIGNYHLSYAYGGVCLHRTDNESGGVSTPIGPGYNTKRELYEKLHAFISGI